LILNKLIPYLKSITIGLRTACTKFLFTRIDTYVTYRWLNRLYWNFSGYTYVSQDTASTEQSVFTDLLRVKYFLQFIRKCL